MKKTTVSMIVVLAILFLSVCAASKEKLHLT